MIIKILYVLFFFFTQKQIYASRHFTGSAQSIGCFVGLFGFTSFVLELAALIHMAIKETIVNAILLFVISIAITFIFNSIISKIVLSKTKNECNQLSESFFDYYNYKCDVTTTIIALLGVVYNIATIVYYFVS